MSLFLDMFPIALMFASPIIIAALGGLFSERSGIVNIALEGIMMVGGFTAAALTYFLEPVTSLAPLLGLTAGAAAGLIFSFLHALASVNLRADQIISGTALNILAGGLTVYLCQIIFKQQRTLAFSEGIKKITVPYMENIPLLGPLFFRNNYPTFFLALALVLITWFIMEKTVFGLRLKACGEHPQAAATMGIDVYKMRYAGVLISGALAGLAGSAMVLTQDIQYTVTSIHGTGFIALASLIFGKWRPWTVLGAAFFFGFSQAISLYARDIGFLSLLPLEAFQALPYVLTILALIAFSSRSVGPRAVGQIYDPSK
ncbi:ABC transporter permease [Spirochaetia bacterium 38H-sp]|uniref:ABC transporter permease n=1 Tax=Rarispira pelagica TaxID=3141764 RepID=A0ABU9UCN5_9SPIR